MTTLSPGDTLSREPVGDQLEGRALGTLSHDPGDDVFRERPGPTELDPFPSPDCQGLPGPLAGERALVEPK